MFINFYSPFFIFTIVLHYPTSLNIQDINSSGLIDSIIDKIYLAFTLFNIIIYTPLLRTTLFK